MCSPLARANGTRSETPGSRQTSNSVSGRNHDANTMTRRSSWRKPAATPDRRSRGILSKNPSERKCINWSRDATLPRATKTPSWGAQPSSGPDFRRFPPTTRRGVDFRVFTHQPRGRAGALMLTAARTAASGAERQPASGVLAGNRGANVLSEAAVLPASAACSRRCC